MGSNSWLTLAPTQSQKERNGEGMNDKERIPKNGPPTTPGEMLLKEFLEPLGMTQKELATRLGVSYSTVQRLIHNKTRLGVGIACKLELVTSMPASFWIKLQRNLDMWNRGNR